MDKHLDGLRQILDKSQNATFIALQMKAFAPKNFNFHAGIKKCHFGNFLE
jgi:hypothetical protein